MKPFLLLFSAASLLATPVLVVQASHRVADGLGKHAGGLAAQWLAPLRPRRENAPVADVAVPPSEGVPSPVPVGESAEYAPADGLAAPRGGKRPSTKSRSAAPIQAGGVRVSARQVLALAERRVMPRAVGVPASETHPAGLRLLNVSNLGVGMRDGDILTRVAGAPASSPGAVVELVLRARAAQAREISAEFWRNGARWSLVVEQPYLTTKPSSSGGVVTERTEP